MDDESYFTLNADQVPGNDSFYTQDKEDSPLEVKSKRTKVSKKVLMWIGISDCSHSESFFLPSDGSTNGETYQIERISRHLTLFIYQLEDNHVFQ